MQAAPPAPKRADESDDEYKARVQREAMERDGVSSEEKVQTDYFAFEKIETFLFPDGKSYVEHKVFTEGQRAKFLDSTNRDVTVLKGTGDLRTRLKPGTERRELLKTAIVGWNLVRNGDAVAFTPRNLDEFLDKADPSLIDKIEKDVRRVNSWLLQEVSLDDLLQQRDELDEMIEKKKAEEAGKPDSSSK